VYYEILSSAHLVAGDLEAAEAVAREGLARTERNGILYLKLATIRAQSLTEADAARIHALLDTKDQSPLARQQLCNTLYRFYERNGEADRAFDYLCQGNAIMDELMAYDIESRERWVDEMIRVFDAGFFADLAASVEPVGSSVPVFVFGMPRSGTTLVEQVLASHAQVHGAGELNTLAQLVERLAPDGDPQRLADAGGAALERLAREYVDHVSALAPKAGRVVDKTPANNRYAGLIAALMPQATLIECRRDPVDNCLSCFSTDFATGHAYSRNLEKLGRFYRGYDRLMRHWHELFPGRILTMPYEEVVRDLEGSARTLVAHCRLDWDPACLEFHASRRPVHTASASQVRQPLYASSVGRAQAIRHRLGPLLQALGPLASI
jgi:hypothetical protein